MGRRAGKRDLHILLEEGDHALLYEWYHGVERARLAAGLPSRSPGVSVARCIRACLADQAGLYFRQCLMYEAEALRAEGWAECDIQRAIYRLATALGWPWEEGGRPGGRRVDGGPFAASRWPAPHP